MADFWGDAWNVIKNPMTYAGGIGLAYGYDNRDKIKDELGLGGVDQIAPYSLPPEARQAAMSMLAMPNRGVPSASAMGPSAPGAYGGGMPWAGQSFGPPPGQGYAMGQPSGVPGMVTKDARPYPGRPQPQLPTQPVVNTRYPGQPGPQPLPTPREIGPGQGGQVAQYPQWGGAVAGGGLPQRPQYEVGNQPRELAGSNMPLVGGAQGAAPNGAGPMQVNSTFGNWLGGYQQAREQQIGGANMLRDAAMGATPSVAELQLRQGQEQNMRQSFALANSGRGNPMMGITNAQNANAIGGQQLNQQQAILRAGEMAQARGQYNQALAGIAGQDIGVAQTGGQFDQSAQVANQGAGLQFAGLDLQGRALDDAQRRAALQALMGADEMGMNAYFRPAEINAGIQAQNNATRQQFYGGLFNAGASLLAGG